MADSLFQIGKCECEAFSKVWGEIHVDVGTDVGRCQ